MLELSSSPLKPRKPAGIQWREREDQSKQHRNALHQSKLLLSALPLACHGMCNYSTIKVPVLVTVGLCVSVCVRLTVLGDHTQQPCQQCGLDRTANFTQVSRRGKKTKGRVDMKRKHFTFLLDVGAKGKSRCSRYRSPPPPISVIPAEL